LKLAFDPAANEAFWSAIRTIPGFPVDDEIRLRKMIFESDAIFRLPSLLRDDFHGSGERLLMVMDATPMRRGSADLKPLVLKLLRQAGLEVEPVVLQPDGSGQVHTTLAHIETVKTRLSNDALVLSVGSGVVTDITKHACYLYESENAVKIPYVVYQTANSVSAYTSNWAPVFVNGIKRSLPSRYPDMLVCDLETLRDAPREMTLAGAGDMLAIYVSLLDWYLAHRLGMDSSYSGLAQALVGPLLEILQEYAEAILHPTLDGMAILAKLITLGGLAMSLTHATTPMSGYEHVISHILDLINEKQHQPLTQHGLQVALSTIIGVEVYQTFLREFIPENVSIEACYPSADKMRNRILKELAQIDPSGAAGEECWTEYAMKLEKWHANRAELMGFLADWPDIQRKLLSMTCSAGKLARLLKKLGAPVKFDQLNPPLVAWQVKYAFMNAPLMRKRFTLGDLLLFTNWDREALWEHAWGKTQGTH
jgi:glycerol-1-phosphate dehydrogenase [NAD(P)+]